MKIGQWSSNVWTRFCGAKWVIFLGVIYILTQNVFGDMRRLRSRVITTKYGALRGFITTLPNRQLQLVEVYLGIPYASAPIGSLRFMPPVTPAHWRGIRTADRFGPVCPQRLPDIGNETEALRHMPFGRLDYLKRVMSYLRNQSEDCLYLNVYCPASVARESSKLPVIVFIHGESYEWNSGNPYDGSVLSSYGNVIVVTLNYRLGILGFLPALEGAARGNYGLMDQVAALHWIQENIREFGGDPKNVTIFGQGYGAACVHLLMLSPMARGEEALFHRAIMHSGSALSPWAIAKEAHTYTRHLARVLGCPLQENALLVECLRQKSLSEIMRVELIVPEHLTAFGPTVDGIVIPKDPILLMHEYHEFGGPYDLLFGSTRVESYFRLSANEEKHGVEPEHRDQMLRTLVRNLFSFHLQEILLTIINEYTDWTRAVQHPMNILESTVDAMGDALVLAPLIKSGSHHATSHANTYFFVFAHQTEFGDFSHRLGCIQGEDLPYVFGAPLVSSLAHFPKNFSRSEIAMSEAVMSMWVQFAKTGNPNVPSAESDNKDDKKSSRTDKIVWLPYESVHQRYLAIGTKSKLRDHYHAHRLSLWLNLIPKFHRRGGTNVPYQHHLLEDHDNPQTYDGVVRQVAFPAQPVTLTTNSPPAFLEANTVPSENLTYNVQKSRLMYTPAQVATQISVEATPPTTPNITNSLAVVMQESGYSTVLGVTIAVGCSLLILNVLIFAGVYYQRDRRGQEVKNSNIQLREPKDTDGPMDFQMKQTPPIAPPPSPAGKISPPQEFAMVPRITLSQSTIQTVPIPGYTANRL